jgi:hypothetical protein
MLDIEMMYSKTYYPEPLPIPKVIAERVPTGETF